MTEPLEGVLLEIFGLGETPVTQFVRDIISESEEPRRHNYAPDFKTEFYGPSWRDFPPTPNQIRAIQRRKGGPNFTIRLPELFYRNLLYEVAGVLSSKDITRRGHAYDILDLMAYTDHDVLSRLKQVLEAELCKPLSPDLGLSKEEPLLSNLD